MDAHPACGAGSGAVDATCQTLASQTACYCDGKLNAVLDTIHRPGQLLVAVKGRYTPQDGADSQGADETAEGAARVVGQSNWLSLRQMSFKQVLKHIKCTERPITIRFRRYPGREACAEVVLSPILAESVCGVQPPHHPAQRPCAPCRNDVQVQTPFGPSRPQSLLVARASPSLCRPGCQGG